MFLMKLFARLRRLFKKKEVVTFPAAKGGGSIKIYRTNTTLSAADLEKMSVKVFYNIDEAVKEMNELLNRSVSEKAPDSPIVSEANRIIGGDKKPEAK